MVRSAVLATTLGVSAAVLGCSSDSRDIDWSAKEDFFIVEKTEKMPDGVRMEFHSLVDAPAQQLYDALADVENYANFVQGVQDTKLVSAEGDSKVINIAQTVIGQQSRAQVKWTFDRPNHKIEFQTLSSDANYNDGTYEVIASPDGQRAYVISVFHVKEKGRQYIPIGVLESATRESFEKAARSIKRRIVGER